jgi:hypothetical protein
MALYDQVVQLADRMTLVEKVRLLEYLSGSLKHDLEIEAYKHIPWEQFIDLTYGSFADDPLERNQPLYPDVRDEIE